MSVSIRQKNPGWIGRFTKMLLSKEEKEIAVGFPKGKARAYPDGTDLVGVAAANCFGIGIPKRDFMTYAKDGIDKRTKDIIKLIAKEKDEKVTEALQEAAGQEGVAAIQDSIMNGPWEPNSPITVALKGSSRPLIDTRHMHNNVTYIIRKKSK